MPKSAAGKVKSILQHEQPGTAGYFRRTLMELADIKEAIDQVLCVVIADTDGMIKYVNDRFCELYGYSRDELIGKPYTMLSATEHSKEFRDKVWSTILRGETFTTEVQDRGKDGRILWSYMVIVPFMDVNDKPYQFVTFRSDITALKEAELEKAKLLKAQAALAIAEAAVQARDRVVSIAAHELKTPLTSLQLLLDHLKPFCRDESRNYSRETLTKIMCTVEKGALQTRRMNSIINDLLDVSRIAAGSLKINPEKIDLAEVVKNLVVSFSEDFGAAGCEVSVDAPESVRGFWDKTRMEQVIVNLISNAMKYGGRKPILISVKQEGQCARIEVQDHGIGIPDEFKAKLFQRFERAATVEQYRGVGLGLWITKQIVDAHGGVIRVESEVNRGSKFVVELPMA